MTEKVDFSGAIKNGLGRGESLEEIKNSLINAGYEREQVSRAIQETDPNSLDYIKESHSKKDIQSSQDSLSQDSPIAGNVPVKPKKNSKWLKILITLTILLIIGVVLAFIFQDFIRDLINDLL